MGLAAGLTVLALLKSFVVSGFGYGLGNSFMIPEVEDVFSNSGPHDFEEIPFQHNVPELNIPNSKMRNLDSRMVLVGTPVVQQQIVQMPFGQPIGFQPWPTLPPPPQPVQPQVMQPWQPPTAPPVQMQAPQPWQLTAAPPQAAQPWQSPTATQSQSWQQPPQPGQPFQQPPSAPVAQPIQTLPPLQPWQQPQPPPPPTPAPVQAWQQPQPPPPPTPAPVQAWQQPTPTVSPTLPPQQPTGQAWQQSSQPVQATQPSTPLQPSQDPRFLKYFPSSVSAQAAVDDLFGRGTTFPSSIRRFGKYFNGPVQPTFPPAPVVTPPAVQPTLKSSITNLQNFLSNSFSLSMIDTDSKKCDATATFSVGSKRYLVAFQNPNCQNMTWGGAANFCQSRGLATFSPTSGENAEAITKIGSLLKPGFGFWTDGIVSKQNGKLPMVIWTVVSNDPVPVNPGDGLSSNTLFRSNDKSENDESCIGLFNNKNKDGIKLYDVVCNAALGVVCQSPF